MGSYSLARNHIRAVVRASRGLKFLKVSSKAVYCSGGLLQAVQQYTAPTVSSTAVYQLVKELTTEKQGKSTTIQDKSGKCLTEENEIFNRWTEYLNNYETDGDPIVLDCPQTPDEEHCPILREEVEVQSKR